MKTPAMIEELLGIRRVMSMTGLGRAFIYEKIKLNEFPKAIRIGRRALWIQSELQEWIQERISANRR